MRIVFDKEKVKESEFFKFCKENNASYFETGDKEYAVWIIDKQYGENLMAIKVNPDGKFEFGYIVPNCNNFEKGDNIKFFKEEGIWICKILKLLEKWKLN
jgi:hypothetical protein